MAEKREKDSGKACSPFVDVDVVEMEENYRKMIHLSGKKPKPMKLANPIPRADTSRYSIVVDGAECFI